MILDRYYYQMLSDHEKKIYKKIFHGIEAFDETITVSKIDFSTIRTIVESVIQDNPHLFYVDINYYEYTYSLDSVSLRFNYAYSKNEKDHYQKRVNEELIRIIESLGLKNKSEYDIALCLHDYLCSSIEYKHTGSTLRHHTVIGALFDKEAVCDGYSRTFKYICNVMQMKCIVVVGKGKKHDTDGHAWNIVSINNTACHVDVTWDSNKTSYNCPPRFYFGLEDQTIRRDHVMEMVYPVCNSAEFDYLVNNGRVFYSPKAFQAFLKKEISRKREIIDFRLVIQNSPKSFRNIVLENVGMVQQQSRHQFLISFEINDLQNSCRLILKYR